MVPLFQIYQLCRFDKAFYPSETSVWCSPLDRSDLKVIEYYEDLEYYYKNGYAQEINYKMSCPLIRDMAEVFK